MHHVAIMNKSWQLIPKILLGQKTIESRWYQTKRTPWNKIQEEDTVFFKNSGEKIIAKAVVSEVLQFEITTQSQVRKIIKRYGQEICLVNANVSSWRKLPRYCVLIRLKQSQPINPALQIDKQNFGTGTAWLTIDNIDKIKI